MRHSIHLTDEIGVLNMECEDCQMLVQTWMSKLATRGRTSDIDGWALELTHEELDEAVRLAVTAASLCWSPAPTGSYQKDLAGQIANELIEHIRRLRRLEEFI